jgi:ComF family protein
MQAIKRLSRRFASAVLELVYPARCSTCDAACDEGAAFCEACGETLEAITAGCDRCGLPLAGELAWSRCLSCAGRAPPYVRAHAPFEFGGALARAVRRMKWARKPELGGPLGRLLDGRCAPEGDVIVPVPLHPRRLRAREFNQAALLAFAARRSARSPPVDVHALERVRDTPPQTELGLVERRANVRGAFRARAARVRGRRVTLVDDVMTTGATAEACSRALLDAGAREVVVLTLARAMP